ncbi:M1 family metallopeptidase [Sphingomonas sp. ACRSK]|uniref:M1 family metallopeptidase n=1 Tax=Sphingomonas sp. ACRSK TaxID=2918213 RepID=UPI001EF6E58E|nr:M1 family metallopeptidase [Sphingomonas sp. ACRSK]MCG7349350.1 M1 family metallopeptidase [Sphingomonas sp. ACRSK]
MFKIAAPLLPLLLPLSASAQPTEKGMPPISAQTQRSGGALSAERAALRLHSADLAIEVVPARQQLSGVGTLELRTLAPVRQLRIDLDTNLPVSTVAVAGKTLPRAAWSHADGVLTVTPNSPVAAGASLTLRITYAGTPHVAVRAPWDDGIVWSQAPGGAHWVATTAQGYGCDLFWPCLDFPQGEPAVVTLHITVPKGLKAPANGVLLGVDTLADGRTTWNWRAKTINPYDIALNIGPYAELSGSYRSRFGNSVPLHYWYLPGKEAQAKRLFAEFAPTLDFFETLIGPFPFGDEKLGVVETPHMGMEHQTINAYGNNYAQAPEGFDWLFQHELSHEWFGNQMTAADWDDFWLHEGFAQYMQPLYGRWREGDARYAAMMAEQRLRIFNKAPLVSGTSRTSEEVYEDGKGGPGGDIYFKGAWVLHTLRNLIGDAAFFDATRRLVYGRPDPRPGNFQPRFATTPEFEKLAAQAAGRDLHWFFDIYVHEAALPELVETRDGDQLHLRWKTPNARPFPMPVEVQVGERLETVLMTGNQGSLTVPAGAHVVIDPMARILRRSEAVERYQAQRAAK